MKPSSPHRFSGVFCGVFLLLLTAGALPAQVPRPREVYGFTPGDDYKLATYGQMLEYYTRLATSSDRVQLHEIGKSVLGRPLLLLTISSEANLRQLDRWRRTSEQLARARIDDDTARRLAGEGKAVVWIDGGLHATEVAHAQMTSLLAYRVATEETPEMEHIRDNVILLLMPVMNPDGLDIVASWYARNRGTPYETTRPPVLYHHYVGHDNNRDWFMNNMPESQAVTKVLYNEWYPQIVYNHHQSGPRWTRIFIPPFADPVNPNIPSGVTTGVDIVGSAMANRFAMKKMPGAVSGVTFSMWWDGGMRTVPYFHNMIGILTETSHATPTPRFFDPDSLPKTVAGGRGANGHPTDGTSVSYPYPWKGGMSHFSDPVRYMITASMAVLRLAADLREQWLYNVYRMGRDAIEKGEAGDPYAYVIPAEQWNKGEDVNLVNVLRIGGVEVEKAIRPFTAAGRSYSAGAYVVYAAQAFRPYVLDLLDKQVYPDRRSTPGGPPQPPYDIAGWTLPMQMGVHVDRIDAPFHANTEPVAALTIAPAPGHVDGEAAYVLSHRPNASVEAVNRLLREGERVYWSGESISAGGRTYDAGAFIIQAKGKRTRQRVEEIARTSGLDFQSIERKPNGVLYPLKTPKVALYKSWVSNIDEGWTRWLLDTYAFAPDTLHDADIRTVDLSKYHAIILPSQDAGRMLNGHAPGTMPAAYTGGLGVEGAAALKRYAERGGTVIALDAASDFAIEQFGLPVQNTVAGVSPRQFFIPGSLIRMEVETDHPLAYGMEPEAAASFVRSRAFRVVRLSRKGEGGKEDIPEAPSPPVEIIAHYAEDDILMSGWALGEKKYIGGRAAMMRVRVGKGDVILFGFRPQFRGQSRGTYKLLFNALHGATLDALPSMSRAAATK